MPFLITHWINVLSMFFLILSGFYIHFPLFGGFMGWARGTHFFWMFVILINLFARIIMSFFVKSANQLASRKKETDIKNWLPQTENRHQLWPTVKYYLFMKKDYLISAKYASLQKIAYLMVPVLILLAGYTGFCLWPVTQNLGFFQAGINMISGWFDPGAGFGGGALMPVRIVHYWIMWGIICFTMIHVYLANVYTFAPTKLIFAWIEDPTAEVHEA
ncbi:MAG: cytochrome b/b6 domain-containing protein [Coriobacteriia bacterium]|nr:cytochrome b/b6 domain-containing protein [Coriobacteriia bacterium]